MGFIQPPAGMGWSVGLCWWLVAAAAAAAATISDTVKEAASEASETPDSHACKADVDGGSV